MQLHPRQRLWLLTENGDEVMPIIVEHAMRDIRRAGDANSTRRVILYFLVSKEVEINDIRPFVIELVEEP